MEIVKEKHDTDTYECDFNGRNGYKRDIFDINLLYESYLKAKKNSDWKAKVQKFEMNYLMNLFEISDELRTKTYKLKPSIEFTLRERGKTRFITGEQIPDRIVKHALCDEYITPTMKPYLIYDNGASMKGKGISFTRDRLDKHLRKFYRKYGNNGYILLIDYSKYYDNIRHDVVRKIFSERIDNDYAMWLIDMILDDEKVDVSYMSDEEYENCMNEIFNSLEYLNISKNLLTGDKFMAKHLKLGDQLSQNSGISYPLKIDNYIKIVKGQTYYGRYADDSYVINHDKQFLENLLNDLIEISKEIGININIKKTKIVKLSTQFKFLQIRYRLTDTGKIVKKITPKRLNDFKRKMRKLVKILPIKEYEEWFYSWFKNNYKLLSKTKRKNLCILFENLKEENYAINS